MTCLGRLRVRSALSDCRLVNGREFAFQRVLLSLGLEEAARGFLRDVVELAVRAPAQISPITNAVTDVDAVILQGDGADPLDPLPIFAIVHLHIPTQKNPRHILALSRSNSWKHKCYWVDFYLCAFGGGREVVEIIVYANRRLIDYFVF
jgi:hypothetical protein